MDPSNSRLNRKEVVTGGNWHVEIHAYTINPDGTSGTKLTPGTSAITNYHWNTTSQDGLDREIYENDGAGAWFLLRMNIDIQTGVDGDEGAYSEATNFRLVTPEGTSYPCSPEEAEQCGVDGGNIYFASPIVHEGETLSGCYYKDSCFANLPSVLGSIQSWTCENTAEVNTWIAGGAVALIVGGGVVAVASPYVMAAFAGAASEAGLATVPLVLTEGAAFKLALAAAGLVAIDLVSNDGNLTGQLLAPAIDISGYTIDQAQQLADATEALITESPAFAPTANGSITQTTGQTLADVLLESTSYKTGKDLSEEQSNAVQRNVKAALATCVATLTVQEALELLPDTAWAHPITVPADFIISGATPLHFCSGIPMIVQAGRALTSETPIAQATMHQNEALFGTDPYSPTQPLHETQPNVLPQTPPHTEWIYLERDDEPRKPWYTGPDYLCKGTRTADTDCDEYPWAATAEGGVSGLAMLTPHLRIINASQNRASGSELGTFFVKCGVSVGEHFLSIPAPNRVLITNWFPDIGAIYEPVPTAFVGPTCVIP